MSGFQSTVSYSPQVLYFHWFLKLLLLALRDILKRKLVSVRAVLIVFHFGTLNSDSTKVVRTKTVVSPPQNSRRLANLVPRGCHAFFKSAGREWAKLRGLVLRRWVLPKVPQSVDICSKSITQFRQSPWKKTEPMTGALIASIQSMEATRTVAMETLHKTWNIPYLAMPGHQQASANTSVDVNVVFGPILPHGDLNTSNAAIVIFTYFSLVFSYPEGM
jgi:hypothetical protein